MKKKNTVLLILLLALLLPGRVWAGPDYISADGFVINNDAPYRFLDEEIIACVLTEDMDPMMWWPCGLGAAVFGVTIEGPGINAIAYQPWDGKILIGGDFTLTYNGQERKNLARLEIDGRLDTAFSPTTDLPVHAIALAPDPVDPKKDSRIYIGGRFTSVTTTAASASVPAGTVPRKGLARLKSGDGSLDPFDPGNVATAVTVNAIAVQPDKGSVVVGGAFTALAGAGARNLARLSLDGTVAGTFGEGPDGTVNAIALQDGLVVIGGEFTSPQRNLARYWIDDSVDPSFSSSPDRAVRSLAVQADRSVVLGGDFLSVTSGGTDHARSYLARVTVDGKLDDFSPSVNGVVRTLAVPPEGAILAAGDFTQAAGAVHKYLAKFTHAGSVEPAEHGIDAPVNAIVVQQDGDFLVGGKFEQAGGKHRTRLARFYPEGALDDEGVPPDPSLSYFWSLNYDSKGYITVIGGSRMFRLGRNFEYDPAAFPEHTFLLTDDSPVGPSTQAQLPNGYLLVGGAFDSIDGHFQRYITRLTPEGAYDPTFKCPFNVGFDPWYAMTAIHLLPAGSVMSKDTWVEGKLMPKGTPLEEGMMYVFGGFPPSDPEKPMVRLLRLKKDGEIDKSFNAPSHPWEDIYDHVLIQPDDKILLFKEQVPQLIRLETDGTVDDTFVSPRNTSPEKGVFYHGYNGSALQRDGQILIALDALELVWPGNSPEPTTTIWPRGLARLNNLQHRSKDGTLMVDGSIDTDFAPASMYNDHDNLAALAEPYTLIRQADGKTFVFGLQTKTSKKDGGFKQGDWLMRFGTDGQVDDLPSLMSFYPYINAYPTDLLDVALQTDGKIVVSGKNDLFYFQCMERTGRTGIIRFNNDTPATQELTVSPEGTSITWLRGGSSPEVARVQFEESDNPGGPWKVLGRGEFTDGGWILDKQNLPRNVNRYVRAVGWHDHARLETSSTMIASVRRYHLKPILTVTARGDGRKTYGDKTPETLDYDVTGFVDGDTRSIMTGKLAREEGENAGSYAIKQGTLYAGPKYLIKFTGANFTIDPATLTVRANDYDKVAGEENPPFLDYTPSGFVNGDTRSIMTGNLKRDEGEEPGIYTIRQWTLSAGPNYVIDFIDGTFTIKSGSALLPQEIIFNPMRAKTFGDADFDPGATATSHLAVSYSSSNTEVAQVVDGRIRVVAPGSSDITATRAGDGNYEAAAPKTQPLLVNPPPWHALAFDGVDDVLRVNDGAGLSFDAQPGFTIESWLRLDGPQTVGAGLVSKGSGARGWQLILDGDRIAAEISDGVSTVGVPEGLVGKTSLNDGAWHHVALSVDRSASSASLYLDGRLEAEVAVPGVSVDNADPLRVGVDRLGTSFFKGAIDEVRIWKAARTKVEIRSGQSSIIQPAEAADLVAYFHLDEGDAATANPLFTVAPERTARSANGSLQGFALDGAGSNWVDSGAFLPLLETSGVSAVTSGSAISGGAVYPNYYDATDRGICWSTSPNPVLGPDCLHSGSGAGKFILTMTGLKPGTSYHVRAFAVNHVGTAYSNDVAFPTPKLDQTIEVEPLPPKTYGDGPFTPAGKATSGLSVTYTSRDTKVAVVEGGQIRITGAGSVTITASQGGDDSYNPAPSVPLSLTVAKAPLDVTADNKSKLYLQANPALTVSYRGFVNGDTASDLSGSPTLTTTAGLASPAGSYPISIAIGNLSSDDYAFNLHGGTLTVGAAWQEIKFAPLRARTFGDADFDPGATASSGLQVEYATSKAGVAAVVDRKIRVMAPGSANITASQDGNPNFSAAAKVTQLLTVNPPPWNGLAFDGGNDVVTVPQAAQLNLGASRGFTIETWLRLDGSQLDGTGLVSKGSGGAGYQLILHGDRIAAELSDGVSTVGVAEGLVGSTSLNDGAWHHVALSVDRSAGSASLYLDGRLETKLSNQALGVDTDNTGSLRIGVDRRGSRFFNGAIDELRLWKSARNREEIRSDVSRIIDPLEDTDLVAYFHLHEGDAGLGNPSYKTAPERTATGAHGTLGGFALSGAQSNWVKSGAFLPLLETSAIVPGDSGSASSGGLVYANYYPATDRGLCWGASAYPAIGGSCVHKGSGAGAFSAAITGLKAGGTYHVRAFAVNQMGTAYGNDLILQMPRLDQKISLGDLYATYGDPPFLPGGTASSGLPVSYTSADPGIAVIVNGRIQITGAGSTTITASQPGDGTYNPSPDLPVRLVVAKAPLTVRADDKARAFQTPNPPLTFSYTGFVYGEGSSVLSGQPLLSTTADQSSPVGGYPITVDVSQLVSNNYRFIPANGTLTVVSSCQEIIFPPIPPVTYGDPPFVLNGGACSGLEISFSSSNAQVAQVSGKVVTITGAGSAVITASQSGSGSVDKAPNVSQTLVVNKRGQSLTFPSLESRVLEDAPFTPGATSSSGLPVSYQSSDPAVATASGSRVTIVGAGTTVITALQEGDANHNPALPASQPLTVREEGIAPALTLSTLSSGSVTADPVLNIAGSASDASGIASLTVNGVEQNAASSHFSSAVPLAAGDNSITVTATDGAGNRTSGTITVTMDAAAPAITASAPADNSVSNASFFTAGGKVTPGSSVVMTVNGASPQSLAVSDGSFTGSSYLAAVLNTIEFTASLDGRSSRIKRSVTYAPGKPYVAVTDPAEDLRTGEETLTLKGIAGAEGSAVTVSLQVGGATLTPAVQQGGFQQQITLERGETRISASVTDSGGNSSVAWRNIIRLEKITGDLNGDGRVDISDAAAAMNITLGIEAATPETLARGDVAPLVEGVPQPDGKIDVGDVLVILRKVVGLASF